MYICQLSYKLLASFDQMPEIYSLKLIVPQMINQPTDRPTDRVLYREGPLLAKNLARPSSPMQTWKNIYFYFDFYFYFLLFRLFCVLLLFTFTFGLRFFVLLLFTFTFGLRFFVLLLFTFTFGLRFFVLLLFTFTLRTCGQICGVKVILWTTPFLVWVESKSDMRFTKRQNSHLRYLSFTIVHLWKNYLYNMLNNLHAWVNIQLSCITWAYLI